MGVVQRFNLTWCHCGGIRWRDDKKEKASTEPKQETQAPAAKEEPKKEEAPKNKPGVSSCRFEFDQIQNNMSYNEVKAIIGSDGELLSESSQTRQQFHTIMCKLDGEKTLKFI
ncbi:hypothetical protein [Bacillus sp. Ba 3]|uniref:hypothetical protein n=1 Tax=Bacillus sp. Ba 3 TaxID=3397768 RepID=UPI0039DFE6E2